MKYNTPLRLVAIDSDLDDEGGIPTVEVQANDAVTRRVPNPVVDSETVPATPQPTLLKGGAGHSVRRVPSPSLAPTMNSATQVIVNTAAPTVVKGRPLVSGKVIAVVGGVVVLAIVASALILHKPAAPTAHSPVGGPSTSNAPTPSVERPPLAPPATTVAAPAVAAVPSSAKPIAETIRLKVTAQPVEATLSLDGNIVAGHALNLMVPRDRGIHVISASASGYFPFNQQVSFDSDVVLTITLRRSRAVSSRPSVSARAPAAEPKPKADTSRTPVVPATKPTSGFEPGMNLEAPVMRSNAKAIDERNPYKQ